MEGSIKGMHTIELGISIIGMSGVKQSSKMSKRASVVEGELENPMEVTKMM